MFYLIKLFYSIIKDRTIIYYTILWRFKTKYNDLYGYMKNADDKPHIIYIIIYYRHK